MEAKLKALRVADLRDILQKASVAIPAKSNKSDLIAKILASPTAVETFNNQGSSATAPAPPSKPKAPESSHGGQEDDLLAPPEEFDWGSTSAPNGGPAPSGTISESASAAISKPTSGKPVAPTAQSKQSIAGQPSAASKTTTPSTGTAEVSNDEEIERRKKRAARFGVPLVEVKPKTASATTGNGTKAPPKSQTLTAEEVAKAEARAARFGIPKSSAPSAPTTGKKRARSPAPVDTEEMEKRKKRAERFSTGGEAKAQS